MAQRITLTIREINALLETSGDVDVAATFETYETEAERERMYTAYDSGREKLYAMLAKRTAKRPRLPKSN